jgi:hypothetical protein
VAFALAAIGCGGEITSYAVPTTGTRAAPNHGPVAIYASRPPPSGSRELGIVEAHASAEDGSVERLFPELVARTSELGGNALVIDWMGAKAETLPLVNTQQILVPCGPAQCSQIETMQAPVDVMTIVLRGRALLIEARQTP